MRSLPLVARSVSSMSSASLSESAIGFSHSTGLPSSSARRTGAECRLSGVDTKTAFTSGRSIASLLLPVWKSAPAVSARALAREGSRSAIAMNPTDGCLAARRARSVPMRPAPMTAMPSGLECLLLMYSRRPTGRRKVLLRESERLLLQASRQRDIPAVQPAEQRNHRDDLDDGVFAEIPFQVGDVRIVDAG